MAQLPNPTSRQLIQLNNTNILGDLWASFNIDLSENEGATRVGKRLLLNTSNADTSQIVSYPVGFAAFPVSGTPKIFTTAGTGTGAAFVSASGYPSGGLFTLVTGSNVPAVADSTLSDILVSNGELYMTGASENIYYTTDGSTWSVPFASGGSDSANAHMMCAYGGRTYVTRLASTIVSWDASHSVASAGSQYTLQLGNSSSNTITFIRSASNRIWIGTVNTLGGKGYIYEWDGSSNQVTKSYRLESGGALSCVIKDDVPYVIDANGALIVWNGGTFKKLTQLNRRRNRMLWNATSGTNNRFIHPNGMSLIGGKIHAFIDGRNMDGSSTTSSIEETIPTGVYEFDEKRGLIHKYAVGSSKAAGTITDFGQTRIAGAGGLAEMNIPNSTAGRNGTFLVGADYYTTATNVAHGIFFDDSNDTERKSGYFISTKIRPEAGKLGPTVTGIFRKLFILYRKLLNSADRIVVKYRSSEVEPTQMDITWASTTSFTTSDANIANYAVGDEVEIMQGNAAGVCAHIVSITGAGPYTVTIDETVNSSSATAKARFQHWVKLFEVSDQTSTWAWMGISNLSVNWVQLKVWMVFTGQDEIETLVAVNDPGQIAQ